MTSSGTTPVTRVLLVSVPLTRVLLVSMSLTGVTGMFEPPA